MSISLKHSLNCTIADDAAAAAAGQVVPSNWNAEHNLTMATGKLLGRNTAGTGAAEELSLGSGLSMSGTTLNANGFNVALLPGAFDLIGATTEPLLVGTDGTNRDYYGLKFADGATTLGAYFTIPSRRTTPYAGGTINIDVDFYLVGTLDQNDTVIFGIGLIELNAGDAVDTAPPTSSNGYSSATYTIGAAEAASKHRTVTVQITAHSSISAGQQWVGRIQRLTASDTSQGDAYVTGITVYE